MADALFKSAGDGYVMTIPEKNVEFHAQRLRWQADDLKGELAVMCGIVGGKAIDGCLSRGTFNFSSQRARDDHAKYLARRSKTNQFPWLDWIEELYERIARDLRQGLPGVLLRDVPLPGPEVEHSVDGWRLPADDPTIGFGDPEGGKSILSLYVAGRLSAQRVPTLYVDFEWNVAPHRVRLAKLFPGAEPPVHYVKCDRQLVHEAERLRGYIQQHQIRYAVFDSVGYGCTGNPGEAEPALAYFRALRPLGIGSLHLAHITKPGKADGAAEREQSSQRPFGSAFWHASARSTWFIKRTDPDAVSPEAPITIGLYHRKSNSSARYPAIGFQLAFAADRIDVRRVDLADISDLGTRLPVWQRMVPLLKAGALPVHRIAEHLEVDEATIRQVLKRDSDKANRSAFVRVEGGLIGLAERRVP